MRQQFGKLPNQAGWQDFSLVLRLLPETFKYNIYLGSLLLLFAGLGKVKAQYMGIGRET